MVIFIDLKKEDRIKLFIFAKKNFNSWEELYPELKVSRSMFFKYLSGEYFVPYHIFLKLQKMAKIKIKNYRSINKNKYMEKDITPPFINEELAESFGVLNGDGHISNINYEICVVGSVLEKDYYIYLKKLFEKVFNMKFVISKQKNILRLRTYSKKLSFFLNKEYGLPLGSKSGKLKVPRQFFKSKCLLKAYIRGLFDTDGSFYIRRNKDAVVEIISIDKSYLNNIRAVLNYLEIKCGISGKNLYIYQKKEIYKFFKEIKPANTKHLKKYERYLNICADSAMVNI